jgi:hypothetical protein
MKPTYSVDTVARLSERFANLQLERPIRIQRYEPGTELSYRITGVVPNHQATVRIRVERFVGGGFAGQVYQVSVLDIEQFEGRIPGLEIGRRLAMKILVPPSNFSRLFRNTVYAIGFQGPFQLQCNPAAARAGAIWQKFIRRASGVRFGDESCVVDIYATFVDPGLGACGELSEWVEGRTWRLEVDDRLDLLRQWCRNKLADDDPGLGSPEYRSKRRFMGEFVKLLHEMGAVEFARQYEWMTCKSQPNCLKRLDTGDDPATGLTAVDFRAGLALLPYLPMSPGDVKLIGQGIARGSLVQFDRGDLGRLKRYIDAHPDAFEDMRDAFGQLEEAERIYRNSVVDVTHHHVRLLADGSLWRTIADSTVTGWRVRNLIDDQTEPKLRRSTVARLTFCLLGVLPFLGRFLRKIWGRADYRRHYSRLLTHGNYFKKAFRGRMIEKLVGWLHAGRITDKRAEFLADHPGRFVGHLLLSFITPIPLHRMLTDATYFKQVLLYIFIRPFLLLFKSSAREQWLREMIQEGLKNHLITEEDANSILSQIKERYIKIYLISMAVHVCLMPTTHIVNAIVAYYYDYAHPELTSMQRVAAAAAITLIFQITPISPGSIARGIYTTLLVIHERNFKDYNIATCLSFFKYIGYLAFPIQMAYRYPVLARFMAAHWATGAVKAVPVFGEKGALLEHWIFNLFYNKPLTIRRRMNSRAIVRSTQGRRGWPGILIALAGVGALVLADMMYMQRGRPIPSLKQVWWLMGLLPLAVGFFVTLTAGGASMGRRIVYAVTAGLTMAIVSTLIRFAPLFQTHHGDEPFIQTLGFRLFLFVFFSVVGVFVIELNLPEPASRPDPQDVPRR